MSILTKIAKFIALLFFCITVACFARLLGSWCGYYMTAHPTLWLLVGLGMLQFWGMFMGNKKGGE